MKIIALTGGIGSGKSVVGKIFTMLGVPVYDSDSHAKELMESDNDLIEVIKKEFGENIYIEAKLDRKALAAKVFGNNDNLVKLNSLVHPAVMQDFKRWSDSLTIDHKFAIMESAIIIDHHLQSCFDIVISVSAPLELRIVRSMERDKTSREAIMERIAKQIGDKEREEEADFVVVNDDKHSLWQQVINISYEL